MTISAQRVLSCHKRVECVIPTINRVNSTHCLLTLLNWTNAHRRWTLRQWGDVIFSDESRFLLERHEGRRRVYRRVGEQLLPNTVSTASDRRGVMVWGAISASGKSQLVIIRGNLTAQRYINDCLRPYLLQFIQGHNNLVHFEQDNARPRVAHKTRNFLNTNNINVLQWPAMSPDLNPIEHLWDRLDRDVRNQLQQPRIVELEQALINAWNVINLADVRRLCLSMRQRCTAVVNEGEGYTRYLNAFSFSINKFLSMFYS